MCVLSISFFARTHRHFPVERFFLEVFLLPRIFFSSVLFVFLETLNTFI